MTLFEDAMSALGEAQIQHIKGTMPLSYTGRGPWFSTSDSILLKFHRYGISYLSYHTRGNANVYQTLHNEEEYERLSRVIREDWDGAKSPRDSLIFAGYKGEVVGVMSNYLDVKNEDIMNRISGLKLEPVVQGFRLNAMFFKIYLNVSISGRHLVSCSITNGHSGHVAFSYAARFSVGDYEFEIPLVDRIRHLGSIGTVLHNLHDIMEAIRELEIDEQLRIFTIANVWSIIDTLKLEPGSRPAQIIETIRPMSPDNALEFVEMVSQYSTTRGYKSAVRLLNNAVMESVMGTSP